VAVKVTLPPWQKVVDPLAVTLAVGNAFAVTFTAAEVLEQPPVADTVTRYDPLEFTDKVRDVDPFDQR
jgi:hypothetical protein